MRSLFSQKKIHPILFGLPRFATMFFYTSLVILSLPLVVLDKVGENSKGLHLGLFIFLGFIETGKGEPIRE
jgi:hypothetical protein